MISSESVGHVVGALKAQPIVLALVLINTLFLAATVYLLWEISNAGERRDKLIQGVITACFQQIERGR